MAAGVHRTIDSLSQAFWGPQYYRGRDAEWDELRGGRDARDENRQSVGRAFAAHNDAAGTGTVTGETHEPGRDRTPKPPLQVVARIGIVAPEVIAFFRQQPVLSWIV